MISKNFDILTPLYKIHRVSRKIAELEEFDINPGYWVDKNGVGDIINITDATTSLTSPALCLSSATKGDAFYYDGLAAYESHDTKLGRITVIEEPGVRASFGSDYFIGTLPSVGDKISIVMGDATLENNGKMQVVPSTTGTYLAVAKCTAIVCYFIEFTTIDALEIVVP
jgi:hypothetical protein